MAEKRDFFCHGIRASSGFPKIPFSSLPLDKFLVKDNTKETILETGLERKIGLEPKKYVCYCDEVTEEDIENAVKNGASSVKEVIRMTGAMQHCDCKVKNPKGT